MPEDYLGVMGPEGYLEYRPEHTKIDKKATDMMRGTV